MADLITMLSAVAGQQGEEVDDDFNQTVLLLHGDGTNGAQNNTFLDGSTNNFTITRNGNTTQGTFSPFSLAAGEWSNYFDGSGDYLNVADNAAFTMGSGDFTIEAWVYKDVSGRMYICGQSDGASLAATSFAIQVNASNKLVSAVAISSTEYAATSTADFPLNQWVHVAMVRNGGTLSQYINGTLDGQNATLSTNSVNDSSIIVSVGALGNLTSFRWQGYISNARIVKGTAVYTSNFTPSTTPLTAITNTSLLTCQSNRFVDNSTNAFAITRNGDVRVTPFSPFAPSAAYSAGTNGGSGYFDGTGDYLTVADNAAFDLPGDFTLEGWLYPIAFTWGFALGSESAGQNGFILYINNSGFTGVYSNASDVIRITNTVVANQWLHFALVRSGSTITLYFNGVSQATATNTTSFTGVAGNGFAIGASYISSYLAQGTGYVSNLRLVKSAVYTSAFTPPTAPLTAITNTSLLCNFTNAGIIDNTGKNNLETVGNAQIDTTTKKYGTGSLEFDGTGDWLATANSPDLAMGTGNFTIEAWVYTNSLGAYNTIVATRTGAANFTNAWSVVIISTGVVSFYTNGFNSTTTTVSNSTWNHIAVTRNGTTLKIFINGVEGLSTTNSQNFTLSNVYVGALPTGQEPLNGYIDDLRITKGVARYTANFTAPTKAFPDQ